MRTAMGAEGATEIFVPDAFDGASAGTVVSCSAAEGDAVAEGDVLVRLRGGEIDIAVESPLSGRLIRLHVREGHEVRTGAVLAEIASDPAGGDGPSSASAAVLSEHAPSIAAAVFAANALVWPLAITAMAVLIVVVSSAIEEIEPDWKSMGPADIVVLPVRLLRGGLRRARAGSAAGVLRGLLVIVALLSLAVVFPAAIGGAIWLADNGGDGLLAATRLAAFDHAGRVAGLLVSTWFLHTALTRAWLRERIQDMARRVPEAGLTGLVVAGALWVVVCVAVLEPRTWWPAASFRAVVHAMPATVRDDFEDWRASIAESEATEVVRCVAQGGRGVWLKPRVFVDDDGSLIVGVRAKSGRKPGTRSLGILLLALHNQLVPHGPLISVAPGRGSAVINFSPLATAKPLRDVARVAGLAEVSPRAIDLLASSVAVTHADVEVALECSSAAI